MKLNSPQKPFDLIFNSLKIDAGKAEKNNDGLFQQALFMVETEKHLKDLKAWLDNYTNNAQNDREKYLHALICQYQFAEKLHNDSKKMSALEEILDNYPDNHFAAQKLSELQINNLKPHQQTKLLQLQIDRLDNSKQKLEKKLELIDAYKKTSQYNRALNLCHELIDENPELTQPRYKLAILFSLQENWKAAESELLRVIAMETDTETNVNSLIQLAAIQCDKLLVPSRALLTLFAALDLSRDFQRIHPILCEVSTKHRSFSPLIDKYLDISENSKDYSKKKEVIIHVARVYDENLNRQQDALKTLEDLLPMGGAYDLAFIQYLDAFYLKHDLFKEHLFCTAAKLSLSTDNDNSIKIIDSFTNDLKTIYNFSEISQIFTKFLAFYPNNSTAIEIMLETAHNPQDLLEAQNAIFCLKSAQTPDVRLKITLKIINLFLSQNYPSYAFNLLLETLDLQLEETFNHMLQRILSTTVRICDENTFKRIFDLMQKDKTGVLYINLELSKISMLYQNFNDATAAYDLVLAMEEELLKLSDDEQKEVIQGIKQLSIEDFILSATNRDKIEDIFKEMDPLHKSLQLALNAGQFSTAETICLQILQNAPLDTDANFQLIQIYYNSGKWDSALEVLNNFLPKTNKLINDHEALLHYYCGEILHATQEDEVAIEHLVCAIGLLPDFRQAIDLLLTIRIEHQAWEEALPLFDQLLRLTEENEVKGAILKRIAEVYHFFLNNPHKAIDTYEHAILLGGDVNDVPERLLNLYQITKQWDKLILTANTLAEINDDFPIKCTYYLKIVANTQNHQLQRYIDADKKYYNAFILSPFDPDLVHEWIQMLVDHINIPNLNATLRLKAILTLLLGAIDQCQDEVLILLLQIIQIIKSEPRFETLIADEIRPLLVRNVLNRVAQLILKMLNDDLNEDEKNEIQNILDENLKNIEKLYNSQLQQHNFQKLHDEETEENVGHDDENAIELTLFDE